MTCTIRCCVRDVRLQQPESVKVMHHGIGFTRDAAIACSFCAAAMEEVASPTNSIAFNKSHMTYTPQFSSLQFSTYIIIIF